MFSLTAACYQFNRGLENRCKPLRSPQLQVFCEWQYVVLISSIGASRSRSRSRYLYSTSQRTTCLHDRPLISIMTVFARSSSDFHNDCLFFLHKKKLKFKFRTQSAHLRSLFSAFGINIVFFCAKKRQSLWKSESHTHFNHQHLSYV